MRLDAGPLAVMLMEHRQSEDALASLRTHGGEYIAGNHDALPKLRQTFAGYAGVPSGRHWARAVGGCGVKWRPSNVC